MTRARRRFPQQKRIRLPRTEGSGSEGVKQRGRFAVQFDHVGIVTTERKAEEVFVAATRVWITDFQKHPFHIEWLRFEPDSPVTGPVRTMPHVAYRVDSIPEAARGLKVLLEPFDAGIAVVGFYQTADGAVVEFMEYPKR
jgi:hypothetical protein